MVQFRPQSREIIAKIVYYGPPLGGKTTNLRTLFSGYPPNTRGELVVVPTGGDRTIFFDFLPIYAGELRGMQLRVQLYTVPGQVHYNSTRQVVLRGVDGVVFVADSQREMLRYNRDSWENLKDNLLLQGITLSDMPHVLQYNKRDLQDVVEIGDMDQFLNEFNAPFYEAVATTGIGVEETLQGVVKLVVRSLRDRFRVPAEPPLVHREPAPAPRPIAPPPGTRAEAVTKPLRPPAAPPDLDAKVFSFSSPPAPPPSEPATRPRPPDVSPAPFGEAAPEVEIDVFSFAPPPEPPPAPEPSAAPPVAPPLPPPPVVAGPAASLRAGVVGRAAEAPPALKAASPVTLAAAAARSELPPFDLQTAPDELPPPFEPLVTAFEPSPAFDLLEPLPPGSEPPGTTAEPARAAYLGVMAPPAPAAPEMPVGAVQSEITAPARVDRAVQEEPQWLLPEPMRLAELPVPALEGEFTAPEVPPFGGSVATAFGEPEDSPVAAPPAEAFAVLGDPFMEFEAVPHQPLSAAPGTDVFAFAAELAEEPGAEAAAGSELAAADLAIPIEPDAAAFAAAAVEDERLVTVEPDLGTESVGELAAEGLAFGDEPIGAVEASPAGVPAPTTPVEPAFFATAVVEEEAASPGEPEGTAAVVISTAAIAEAERAASAAIQRVVPRGIAQYGEVRELEIEVPVPSMWVGGKRMTLQLRLTLVPQEEQPGE